MGIRLPHLLIFVLNLALIPGLALLTATLSAAPSCTLQGGGTVSSLSAEQSAALQAWSATIAQSQTPASEAATARVQRAGIYRALGRDVEAATDLTLALSAARAIGDATLETVALLALGEVHTRQRHVVQAEETLRAGLAQARRLDQPTLIATGANALGNLLVGQGHASAAESSYREALAAARTAHDAGLAATVQLNLARLAFAPEQVLRELQSAQAAALETASAAERAELLVALAQVARTATPDAAGQALARASLREAASSAARAGLARVQAQALAQSALLSADQGQYAVARQSLAQAISVAPADAYDLRYRWEWQLGQWLREIGDRPRAIAAYRRAVDHLQQIRAEIPVVYAEGRSSFRETLEPLYLGLADLLLQDAATSGDAPGTQRLLREARDTVEQVKLDELRDYFRDACILPLREEIETLSPRAAVFYPVIFAERVELLVGIGPRLYRAATPVTQERLRASAEILALKLRYGQPLEPESEQLYDWLIAPLLPWLTAQRVDTLAFVPDGPLRAVPLGALAHAGRYLIERYAIATVPGLRLLQPEATANADLNALLAGLSRPGPVIDELPNWWVDALVQQNRQRGQATEVAADARGVSLAVRGGAGNQPAAEPLRAAQSERIAALTLPGVAREIAELSRRLPGVTLLDQEFVLNRLVSEMGERPYRVVHIASHGLFQGPPEDNFIVAYDRKLDMKTLAAALKPKELAQRPIELLVLSACQTAEGDDRTPLGLSGVALQSGARSALGSLWPVSDAATQLLMSEFYDRLKQPGMTKARALQEAQQTLLASERYRQPRDWAAFILVGNWL